MSITAEAKLLALQFSTPLGPVLASVIRYKTRNMTEAERQQYIDRCFAAMLEILLGDFEEDPSTTSIVVNGLLGLIPVVDQILDVRDLAACIYRCCRSQYETGGVDSQHWTNLALAGLGAIPEVGSLAKMVLKPAMKAVQHDELAGQGARFVSATIGEASIITRYFKGAGGAAIKYWREFPWQARWSAANGKIQNAYERSLQLLRELQKPQRYLPAQYQEKLSRLAAEWERRMPRVYESMREGLAHAQGAIEDAVADLMGEYAYALEAADGTGNRPPYKRKSRQRYKADNSTSNKTSGDQPAHKDVGGSKKSQPGAESAGPTDKREQPTTRYGDLGLGEIGIAGEHIADYYCAENFGWAGTNWDKHDAGATGRWKNESEAAKLSNDGKLYFLSRTPNPTGIDSVWRANRHNDDKPYAIVEAKASRDEDGPKFARNPNSTRKPSINQRLDDNSDAKKNARGKVKRDANTGSASGGAGGDEALDLHQHPDLLLEPLDDDQEQSNRQTASKKDRRQKQARRGERQAQNSPQPATPKGSRPAPAGEVRVLVQMSEEWISENIAKAVSPQIATTILVQGQKAYSRHLFFSPLYHQGKDGYKSPAAHAAAMLKLVANLPMKPSEHEKHDCYHYDEARVKAAVNKRKKKLRSSFPTSKTLKAED